MYRIAKVWTLVALVCALGALVACGPNEEEQAAAARDEAWTDLQSRFDALQEKRAKLREMRAQIAAGPEAMEAAEDGTSPEEQLQNLEQQANSFEEEIASDAEVFQGDLVNFINENPMVRGEEPTERQTAALRMKSTEDIVLAREYVEKGGDYRRAADILERAAAIDPDNQELEAELEVVKDMRFVTEERFDSVKKGMTQPEVRDLLGQVFHRNIREYQEQGALAWFYAKDGGGAAAVFFRKRDGEWKVYEKDFDAVDPQGES